MHRRVIPAMAVLLGIGLLSVAPPAAAEPESTPVITTVPERPVAPGQTPFTDNPAIVDSHPQSVESWSRLPAADALSVQFTTGTPACYGVYAEVQETTDIVAVKLRSGTVPEAVGRACIAIGVIATLAVELDAPVGHRAVVSIT